MTVWLSSSVCMGMGIIIMIENSNFPGRITTMGFAMGPMNHVWYTMLDAILPGKAASVVVKKILMDQTIAAPFFAFTYFMGKI